MIELDIINGSEVLNQLKKKLALKRIHTYLWNSLIIVNPFEFVPGQYDEEVLTHYIENAYIKEVDDRKL